MIFKYINMQGCGLESHDSRLDLDSSPKFDDLRLDIIKEDLRLDLDFDSNDWRLDLDLSPVTRKDFMIRSASLSL